MKQPKSPRAARKPLAAGLYRVRQGFTVKLPTSPRILQGGELVDLTAELAGLHEHKLEQPTEDQIQAYKSTRAAAQQQAAERDSAADRRRRAESQAQAAALMAQAAALRDAAA